MSRRIIMGVSPPTYCLRYYGNYAYPTTTKDYTMELTILTLSFVALIILWPAIRHFRALSEDVAKATRAKVKTECMSAYSELAAKSKSANMEDLKAIDELLKM